MKRLRDVIATASLVASPLLVLFYWLLYPAYGKIKGEDILAAIDGHAAATQRADLCAVAGALLAVPATLALMRVLRDRSPRLALVGGSMSLMGWVAVVAVTTLDLVAIEMVELGATPAFVTLFKNLAGNPVIVGLDVLAMLHVVGGVVLGVALTRSRLIPRAVALAATVGPAVHLVANVNGVLWLDAMTWLVAAVAGALVARVLLGGQYE